MWQTKQVCAKIGFRSKQNEEMVKCWRTAIRGTMVQIASSVMLRLQSPWQPVLPSVFLKPPHFSQAWLFCYLHPQSKGILCGFWYISINSWQWSRILIQLRIVCYTGTTLPLEVVLNVTPWSHLLRILIFSVNLGFPFQLHKDNT